MSGRHFTCARCGIEYHATNTLDEAAAEAQHNYPDGVAPDDELVSVCDDCYQYVMACAEADGLL